MWIGGAPLCLELSAMPRPLAIWLLLAIAASPAGASDAIRTAPGFELTRIHAVPREKEGSWISLAADTRGRLYASDQYGPVHRISLPDRGSAAPRIEPLALPIGGAHGLTWIENELYVVAGQKSVCATGLYRLRDRDGDGELDHVELLRALEGDGEHGPHAVVTSPDGQSLFVIAGNATRLPALVRSRVPPLWRDDSLLAPLPALMGSETRGTPSGGWICRTDRDGRDWELVAVGLRNAYALARDERGELFTFDSDTEFELNLPWYRPTRALHVVSGADFGWRRGALKVPEHAPDAWPTLRAMGLGSPTAVLFPAHARFPAKYRQALWLADWSYGKIFALHLARSGAGFTAHSQEEIVSALPLPITAMCVNPRDGSLYFTTGGRRQQSALYRLRWTGAVDDARDVPVATSRELAARQTLEALHGRQAADAVDLAWPHLDAADPLVRRAARTALESQPVAAWRERALAERAPRAALAAWLALVRADAPGSQAAVLAALRRLHATPLDPALRREWLRVLALAFARGGDASPAQRADWAELLGGLPASGQHDLDTALIELLVYCESPDAAARGLAALRTAVTREAQLDLAKALRGLRSGWTPALRQEFFDWLASTVAWRGGATFAPFLQRIRDDALAAVPEPERGIFRAQLAAAAEKIAPADYGTSERRLVRAWTTDDLAMLAQKDSRKRDPVRGRRLFGAAGCFGCHVVAGEGGALGPDLTGAGQRLAPRDLIEAIVEPSREINDQYGSSVVTLRDGRRLTGRIVNLTDGGLQLAENLADPARLTRLAEKDIAAIEASKTSLMPEGLLNTFADEEILDLLAFLRAGR